MGRNARSVYIMFSQLLGKYLVDKKVLTDVQLREVLSEQAQARVKLGTIAVAEKLLTEKQAEEINHLQTQMDKRFGDIAIEQGYLTGDQLKELLDKQGNAAMKFIQILTEKKYVDISELDKYLTAFGAEMGFTAEEMKALKNDDIEATVKYFVPDDAPEYVAGIVGLALRNIVRFVTSDFYMDKAYKADGFDYSYIMGQHTVGDHKVYLGFAADKDTSGILELAKGFADDDFVKLDDAAMDAVCEFANMNDGLFASELSDKGIEIDMEPPVVYVDGHAKGTFYIMPVYVAGKHFNMCIAIDSDVDLGDNEYHVMTGKTQSDVDMSSAKAGVLIVDDSMLIRRMLRALLEDNGYAVVGEAADGEEAVEEYKRLKPDIVTLDITMPRLDGVGALAQIMEYDNDAKALMITAAGQKQKVVEALKLGAKAFIMKPFDKEDVLKNFDKLQ